MGTSPFAGMDIVGNGKEYSPGQVLVGGGKVEGQNSLPGLGEPLMASNRGVPDKTVQGVFLTFRSSFPQECRTFRKICVISHVIALGGSSP